MGYTTQFKGALKIETELTATQKNILSKLIFGEDCREHPEWMKYHGDKYMSYIDFELCDDGTGIKWDGSEKSYDMVEKVNLIIQLMRLEFGVSDFKLSGEMLAQGEEVDDRWYLRIHPETGLAVRVNAEVAGTKCYCPSCGHQFMQE